jgi:hypothetical protein
MFGTGMIHPMFEKLNELFLLLGIEPPTEGTTFESCVPVVESAIERARKLLAVVDAAHKVIDDYGDPYELFMLGEAIKELDS